MGHFYDFPLARTLTMTRLVRPLAVLFSLVGLTAAGWALAPQARAQASMFSTQEVDPGKFIIVAAPIGDGSRAQLNIYEQRSAQRPCYAVSGSRPAVVDPLLASFDFTGICNRFIDGNGYSLRIGTADLGTVYRLSVVKDSAETLLMAQPTRPDAGPEMVVARTGGQGNGFLQLVAEPGWRVMRRSFGSRALGHVYVYRDSWPAGGSAPSPGSEPAAPATKLPREPQAPAELKGAGPIQAPVGEKPAATGAKPAAPLPSSGSAPSSGASSAPSQGGGPKPGLGASAPGPSSGTPKPLADAKPNGPIKPVETTKAVGAPQAVSATKAVAVPKAVPSAQAVAATKAVMAPQAVAATKAVAVPKAVESAKPSQPGTAASKPMAAAPLAAAPNLPALPAAAPVAARALP